MKINRSLYVYPFLLFFGIWIAVSGCSKEYSVQPRGEGAITAEADAAASIAGALGEYNGGAMDQLSDLAYLTEANALQGLGKGAAVEDDRFKNATYDPASGVWTIIVSRERGSEDGQMYAKIERVYHLQFLNKNGQPQQFWYVEPDTAYTVKFEVVSASGQHRTPKVSQALKELTAQFIATDVNTETVTINGSYFRAAADTITTNNIVRTHDYTLDLTFTDVKGPRGSRFDWSQKVSGTITGTYAAFITFTRGNAYSERSIERQIAIDLSAGEANIHLGGGRYQGDLYWGQCKGK